MNEKKKCWCGNNNLKFFSPEYDVCDECKTLVSKVGMRPEQLEVVNDDTDFYGKEYWDSHQRCDLNLPNITDRARSDLPERCLHWLTTVLKYKLPPAKVLELGCAHGGFVAILNQAGYDATGLELSPSIVDFAKQTFGVPILCGPVEEQQIPKDSLDVIVLMDVIEHLPDPVSTMSHCLGLLKPDGILVIQCPNYQEKISYKEMVVREDPFLQQLKADEHLYLFSKNSIREFFVQLDAKYLEFEKAIFEIYDMFLVVSRKPLQVNLREEVTSILNVNATGRIIQALLDLHKEKNESESDRATRLDIINTLSKQLDESESDRAARLDILNTLSKQLDESESDRAARLDIINTLSKQLYEVNTQLDEVNTQLKEVNNKISVKLLKKLKLI